MNISEKTKIKQLPYDKVTKDNDNLSVFDITFSRSSCMLNEYCIDCASASVPVDICDRVQFGTPEPLINEGYQSGSGFENYHQAMVYKVSDKIDNSYFLNCGLPAQPLKPNVKMYAQSVIRVFNIENLHSNAGITCNLD